VTAGLYATVAWVLWNNRNNRVWNEYPWWYFRV
jgi:hypothetical protein